MTALAILLAAAGMAAVSAQFVVEQNSVKIIMPTDVSSDISEFPAAFADFGEVPFGQILDYELMLPPGDLKNIEPFEACGLPGAQDSSAPAAYQSTTYPSQQSPNHFRAALVDRGNCKFIEKTFNAQSAKADLVLVVDNVDEDLHTLIAPKDNNFQDGWVYNLVQALKIPTLLISQEVGNQLRNIAKSSTIVIQIDFSNIFEKRDRVSLEYWTSSSQLTDVDRNDQEFKAQFQDRAKALVCDSDDVPGSSGCVDFRPRYLLDSCCQVNTTDKCCIYKKNDPTQCATSKADIVDATSNYCYNDCFKFGRYCAQDPDYDSNNGYSGDSVVRENLRAAAVFLLHGSEMWWKYSSLFYSKCKMMDNTFSEDCSHDVMSQLKIDVDEIHNVLGDDSEDSNIPVADAELEAKQAEPGCDPAAQGCQGAVIYTPVLEINDDKYNGKLEPNTVTKALCSAFAYSSSPSICSNFNNTNNGGGGGSSSGGVSGGIVAVIVIFTIIGTAALFAIFYRYRAKIYMDREIRAIMAEYVSLDNDNAKGSNIPINRPRMGNGLRRENRIDDEGEDDDAQFGITNDIPPGNGIMSNDVHSNYSLDTE